MPDTQAENLVSVVSYFVVERNGTPVFVAGSSADAVAYQQANQTVNRGAYKVWQVNQPALAVMPVVNATTPPVTAPTVS
jgi:hypothetical protein